MNKIELYPLAGREYTVKLNAKKHLNGELYGKTITGKIHSVPKKCNVWDVLRQIADSEEKACVEDEHIEFLEVIIHP